MIELATAALIAKATADAVGAFDTLYRGLSDFVAKREPAGTNIPPPDFAYVNQPGKNAIIAMSRSTGQPYQVVTYEELATRLAPADLSFIQTLDRAMNAYQRQWNAVFEQRPLVDGMQLARLDAQLEHLAKEISECLIHILSFVEKIGLQLDDHYYAARHLAERYANRS